MKSTCYTHGYLDAVLFAMDWDCPECIIKRIQKRKERDRRSGRYQRTHYDSLMEADRIWWLSH